MRLLKSQRGVLSLTSEALILGIIGLVGFGAIAYIIANAQGRMEETSQWVECGNVLECEAVGAKQNSVNNEERH